MALITAVSDSRHSAKEAAMGDLRPENGGGQPPDEGGTTPGGLPDFPPEWGTIIVPDDASELDDEAEALRRELRRMRQRMVVRRLLLLPRQRSGDTSLVVPMIIMVVAILTTLASLFVVTWNRTPDGLPVTPVGGSTSPTAFADLVFLDSAGHPVRMGSLLPAVVVLTDGCAACTPLLQALVPRVPRPVRTVAVGRTAPMLPSAATTGEAYSLADPNDLIRGAYAPSSSGGGPTVLVSDRQGTAVQVIPGAASLDEILAAVRALPEVATPSAGVNAPAHTAPSHANVPRVPIH
jgi:hypothetical protein